MKFLRRVSSFVAIVAATMFTTGTKALAANGSPALYLSDNVVNVAPASCDYNGRDWQFKYDATNSVYYIYIPAHINTIHSASGDFQISKNPGQYSTWVTGLYYAPDNNNKTNEKIQLNTEYTLTTYEGTTSDGRWMTIDGYDSTKEYIIYVNEDCSKLKVKKIEPLYMGDLLVGDSNISGNGSKTNWKFDYDVATEKYRLSVPGKYVGNTGEGDFQISTMGGSSYTNWKKGLIYPTDTAYDNTSGSTTKYSPLGTYNMAQVASSNTGSHWMSIKDYDREAIYTFTVDGDFSKLTISKVNQGLYITGTVAGHSLTLVPPSVSNPTSSEYDYHAYASDNTPNFTYDSVTDIYYYTFTAPVGTASFSYSKYPTLQGSYEVWSKGSSYVPASKAESNTGLFSDIVYPTNAGYEATRYLPNCTAGNTYTIYINSDLTRVWVEEGEYRQKRLFVSGSGFDGIESGKPHIMDYDAGSDTYSYHATSSVSGNYFGLFNQPNCADASRISLQNYISSTPISYENVKYKLYPTLGNGGDQQFAAGATDVTFYIDGTLSYFWAENGAGSENIVVFATEVAPIEGTDNRRFTESAPLKMAYDAETGTYRANLKKTQAGDTYRLSRFASAPADNSTDAFETGLFKFETDTPTVGTPINVGPSYFYDEIVLPELWYSTLVYDPSAGTITLKGSDHPNLYIAGALNGICESLTYTATAPVVVSTPSAHKEMLYDPSSKTYSYTATAALGGNFAVYWDSSCEAEYLYSCAYVISSTPLQADNTKYQIVNDSSKGYQMLNLTGTGNVTINVNLDQLGHAFLWAIDNTLANAPVYICKDKVSSTVGNFELNAASEFAYEIGTLPANTEFILSQFRNTDSTDDDNAAFNSSLLRFESKDLVVGEPIRYKFAKSDYITRDVSTDYTYLVSPDQRLYSARLIINSNDQTITLEATDKPDLFIAGAATSDGREYYDWANPKKFNYDRTNDWYYLTVPAVRKSDDYSWKNPSKSYYFVISTTTGNDQYGWMEGAVILPTEGRTLNDASRTLDPGVKYTMSYPGSASTTLDQAKMLTNYYHQSTAYTYYVKGDLSQVWVQPELFTIGWITGGYTYSDTPDAPGSKIHSFTFDPVKGEYYYQTRGPLYSVYEISTVKDLAGSYNGWCDGMYYYTDRPDDYASRTVQPEVTPITEAYHESTTYYDVDNYHYPLVKGYSQGSESTRHIGDHTITGFNPNNLYTIHVAADFSYMWVTYVNVNMPLQPSDFENGKAHYFLVGTRTADWRLLPEWELTGEGTTRTLKNRFMYDGYFGFARVDNYQDYIHHRYQLFSNSSAAQQNYTSTSTPIDLASFGQSSALHYDSSDPRHDTSNSITWNLDPDYGTSLDGTLTDEMMERSVPWRIETLTLTLDAANGVPTQAAFDGSGDPAVINAHRTFSLCGSDINYEQPYDFGGSLGSKYLRNMAPAVDHIGEAGSWSNAWISFDPYGEPYVDAYGNTLYLTAYDIEWIDNHDVHFDMKVGSQYLSYTTENLFFTPEERLTNLSKDPYKWLYDKHTLEAGMTMGKDELVYHGDGNRYAYRERLLTGYDTASDGDSNLVYTEWDLNDVTDYKGWKCYVIRDVWLKGNFKVWTGWGGNVRKYEGSGNGTDAHRWFYGNLGHKVSGKNYPVKGYDLNIEATAPDHDVVLYQTSRYVDKAYFQVVGSHDVTDADPNANADVTPQFYSRIILWYNVNEGTKTTGEPNGVLFFVQESAGPTAQAFRQVGKANMLCLDISAFDNSGNFADWNVVEYQIERYTFTTDAAGNETEELSRRFNTTDAAAGTTVQYIQDTPIRFNDPYALPAGSYFYRVVMTVENPDTGEYSTKTASSNTITISAAGKPVFGNAEQLLDTEDRYTFNVQLKVEYPDNLDVLKQTSHYTSAVFEDARKLVISADPATAKRLNAATRVDMTAANGAPFVYTAANDLRAAIGTVVWTKNPDGTAGAHAVGFTKIVGAKTTTFASQAEVEAVGTGTGTGTWKSILEFKPGATTEDDWTLEFDLQQLYYHATLGTNRHYFSEAEDLAEKLAVPCIVWHNVEPSSGALIDGDEYAFTISLGTEDIYENTWNNVLQLKPDDASTHVFAPTTSLSISDAHLYQSTAVVDHTAITKPALMPPGSQANGSGFAYPVHYPYVNEIEAAGVIKPVAVADEVTDNWDISLAVSLGGNLIAPEPSNSANVEGTFKSLPPTVTKTTSIGSSDYYAIGTYAYYRPTVAVRYVNKADNKKTYTTAPVTSTSRANIILPTPAYTIQDGPHYQKAKHGSLWHTRCAVEFSFAADDTLSKLYFYPGFHISPLVYGPYYYNYAPGRAAVGGRPVDSALNTYWRTTNGNSLWLTTGTPGVNNFTALTDGEYSDDVNNWSYLAAKSGKFGVQVEPILESATEPTEADIKSHDALSAELYTIYPVVSTNFRFEPTAKGASAPRREAATPVNVNFDDVIPLGVKKTVSIQSAAGSSVSTGVETVGYDLIDSGEAVYYNLQGIRVATPVRGQLYIRATAAGSEKIVY